MALIQPREQVVRKSVRIKVDAPIAEQMDLYCEYAGIKGAAADKREYLITECLKKLFKDDREFEKFLKEKQEKESAATA